MPTISLEVEVPANAEVMWEAVTSPAGFRFVSRGLIHWPVAALRTDPWRQGETVSGPMYVFGRVRVATHSLTFVTLDPTRREFLTNEQGGIIRRWNHHIVVTPVSAQSSRISDSVSFSGGWATPLLWFAVKVFYLIRAPRWVSLARSWPLD